MRRRGWTVLVGAALVAVLTWQMMSLSVPYVVLGPGPTVDTLGVDGAKKLVIRVDGAPTSTSAGQLRFTTVAVQSDLDLGSALYYWLSDRYAVAPRELYYPPDKSREQVQSEESQAFKDSQTSAEISALRELGYEVKVAVKTVVAGGAVDGKLQPGDIITSVDGVPVTSGRKLVTLVRDKMPGEKRVVGYTRGVKSGQVEVTPGTSKDGVRPELGLTYEPSQPHPFKVTIDAANIGGPSAGLMLSLGLLDKLKPEDLTGGVIIAGTGTIDEDGQVGPIGGITHKMRAAREAGAKFFLTPTQNCAEAMSNKPRGLTLIRVNNLKDGINGLSAIREHRAGQACTR